MPATCSGRGTLCDNRAPLPDPEPMARALLARIDSLTIAGTVSSAI